MKEPLTPLPTMPALKRNCNPAGRPERLTQKRRTKIALFVSLLIVTLCVGLSDAWAAEYYSDDTGDYFSTSTTLTGTPARATVGSAVILTSQTTGVTGFLLTVYFYADGSLIGTATTDGSSKAQFYYTTNNLSSGAHTFRADLKSGNSTRTKLVATQVNYAPNGTTVRSVDHFYVRYRDTIGASSGAASFTVLDAGSFHLPLISG